MIDPGGIDVLPCNAWRAGLTSPPKGLWQAAVSRQCTAMPVS
jgi:hypothetical protein